MDDIDDIRRHIQSKIDLLDDILGKPNYLLGSFRREPLDRNHALWALCQVQFEAYRIVAETYIGEWDVKDTQIVSKDRLHEIVANIAQLVGQIYEQFGYIRPGFNLNNYSVWKFSCLKLKYLEEGVDCIEWIADRIHVIIEVPVEPLIKRPNNLIEGTQYFAHYLSPKEAGTSPYPLFKTPFILLQHLIEGKKDSSEVRIVAHAPDKKGNFLTTYNVKGFKHPLELPDKFIAWVREYGNGSLQTLLHRLLDIHVIDKPIYDTVVDKIKAKVKVEPVPEGPSLKPKYIERLKKIEQVKDYPTLNHGARIVGLKSKEAMFSFRKLMVDGGYIRVFENPSGTGFRIELTEKGLRAIGKASDKP